jgi:arsenate reductase (thioredoxin)
MQEIGISLEGHRSKSLDEFVEKPVEYVITVCDKAKESCPIFPAKTSRMHWPFEDPPGPHEGTYDERLAVFRKVRDQMQERLARELESGVFSAALSETRKLR